MKKIDFESIRSKSLLTGKNNLEKLYTMKNFPVFMGCVDTPEEEDIFADMEWQICKDTGLIQLAGLLPLEILYLNQHNDGTGKLWIDHYQSFAEFINKVGSKNILEVGGANDFIAMSYLDKNQDATWTIVEPHPFFVEDKRIKIIKSWFNDKFKIDVKIDTLVHSHVLEHLYDPFQFLAQVNKLLKAGDKHIFTFPNMMAMLKNKFTNCLNFEHTVFLTEDIVDYSLKKVGFNIIAKEYFGDGHSIFYATEKKEDMDTSIFENKYAEYKETFMDFIDYHRKMINDLNNKMKNTQEPIYLFGAHIFSQFLLSFGLSAKRIEAIMDNSPAKQGKRLYGTDFIIGSPESLRSKGKVNIVLKAGFYNEEVKRQLLQINDQITIW